MAARRARFSLFRRGNRRLRRSPGTALSGEKRKRGGPSLFGRAFSLLWRASVALVVCGLLGAGVYGGRYFIYHSPRFAIKAVRINGNHRLATASLEKRAGVTLGKNILELDTHAIETRLRAEPWLKTLSVRRELPGTLRIDLTEHEPAAILALESLYLCDAAGEAFKRATPAEYGELPVITGVGRALYVLEPAVSRTQIGAALAALTIYKTGPNAKARPPIGEVHIDRFVGVTLYTKDGMAIELGQGEPAELDARLLRFDAVLRSLGKTPGDRRPLMVFLDNRAHPDHVTVRFSQ